MIELYAIFRFQRQHDGKAYYTIRQLRRDKEGNLFWNMFPCTHSPTIDLDALQEVYPNATLMPTPIQPNEQPLFDEKDLT